MKKVELKMKNTEKKIVLAKTAGFCFGVQRAVDAVYDRIETTKMATYGPIIHNKILTNDLKNKGVSIIESYEELEKLDKNTTVVIRSHGVGPALYDYLHKNGIPYIDCTCPFVKKIHEIVKKKYDAGDKIIVLGDKNHPEIIGINGWAENNCIIISNISEAKEFVTKFLDINEENSVNVFSDGEEKAVKTVNGENNLLNNCENDSKNCSSSQKNIYTLVVQTTFRKSLYEDIEKLLKFDTICCYNTICNATDKRQIEADKISREVDHMIVIGDNNSSNTVKLYEICKKNCQNSILIEQFSDLQLNIYSISGIIGITAGASTPPAIIEEALSFMSEMEKGLSFEEMLDASMTTLHTGDVVKGTVIKVTANEATINLSYKSDGILTKEQYSDEDVDLTTVLNIDDELEVFIVRVSDGDGNVVLSRKRIESQKGWDTLEQIFNDKEIVEGKLIETVKGGMITLIAGLRVFVPSSQVSSRYVEDLATLVGETFEFELLEFDRVKRRVVAGRRELAMRQENAKKAEAFALLKEGDRVTGNVSRIVDFGAFVNLGGVDGLIHVSEMSWGRVKKASDMLKEGDSVTVTILSLDKEKSKVSLSLKDVNSDPWLTVEENFPVGEIFEGRVAQLAPFGAFVELAEGIDGLVHISQIDYKHISKPEEVLSIGDMIKVKIVSINMETKRISLSKKEAEGRPEGTEEEAAAVNAAAGEDVSASTDTQE